MVKFLCKRFLIYDIINIQNDIGDTVVHTAFKHTDLEMVKWLIKTYNLDLKTVPPNYDGNTLVHLAIMEENLKMVKFLVKECNLDLTAVPPNNSGNTPIDLTIENGHMEILKWLIKVYNLNPDAVLPNDVIYSAVYCNSLQAVTYLSGNCDLSQSINFQNWAKGYTPLHLAVSRNNSKMVKLLIN
jgi:ankyrin repeat protein